jgi:hypothetical protein
MTARTTTDDGCLNIFFLNNHSDSQPLYTLCIWSRVQWLGRWMPGCVHSLETG